LWKPSFVVFHKCLIDFWQRVLGIHFGNTILVDHNLVMTMWNLINNVLLVEKWNGRVEVLLNYLIIVVFLYLEALHYFGKFVSTFVEHNPFGRMPHIIVADIKFRKLLESCSNRCNVTFIWWNQKICDYYGSFRVMIPCYFFCA
jgi:hypothetical protein